MFSNMATFAWKTVQYLGRLYFQPELLLSLVKLVNSKKVVPIVAESAVKILVSALCKL